MIENHEIQIREATLADLPMLYEFEQGVIRAERPFDPTMKTEHFHYYDLKQLIENENTAVMVAEVDQQLVASGHVRIKTGEGYNYFEKYAFLGFMYVVPEMRGKKINQLIINGLVNWANARGLTEVRLRVYDENIAAVKAYEKVGFKKILTEMRLTTDQPNAN